MALLLPHQTVGLVVKMKLWHKCSVGMSALAITEAILLATQQSWTWDADPEGKCLRSKK